MATIADLVIKLSTNSAPAERDMKSFAGKAQRTFGKALLPAVGVLGGLAVAAKGATDKATALGESQNAVNVVFGKSSKTISDFAKVADKEAGLSMRQLNELVTPIGASLINTGDSADIAAQKSVNLAKRAADMASVFNVDVSEALAAIQAGLRGEADPLERFGVGLSDAAVSAKAVQMGLAKTTAELTAGDKAQARYALLMDQTSKLQGDFVRTSGEAANAARINAASQENLQAKLGSGLLPVVKTYQGLLGSVTGFLAEHTTAVQIGVGVLLVLGTTVVLVNAALAIMSSRIVTQLIPAIVKTTAVQWLLNTAFLGFPLVWIVAALVALGLAIVVLWKKCETFRNIVTTAWNAIKSVTSTVFNAIKAFLAQWWPLVLAVMTGGLSLLVALVISKWGAIKGATSAAWGAISGAVSGAVSTVRSTVSSGWDAVKNKVTSASDAVRNKVSAVFGALGGLVRGAVGAVTSAVGSIVGAFQPIVDVLDRILGAAGSAIDALGKVASAAGKVKGAAGGVLGKIPGFAGGVRNFGGGLAVVGEQGPELVNLPRGSDVYTNAASRGMLSTAGGIAGGGDSGGDLVLVCDGEVLGRIARKQLDRTGRRNVGLSFGTP